MGQCSVFEKGMFRSRLGKKDLEGKELSILKKVGFKIDTDNIQDCHQRSKNSDYVKLKLLRKKKCEHVLWLKKGLENLYLKNLGFHEENKIYINQSLCQCCQT